ncbi:hypothetical protein MUU75_09755 [Pseudoxanthomonas mexicana]|uniref:hypothetical protein n=1 Tax=Pseudoxanthomonas mexicana TaxID=128785 RepID=UPI001FD68BE3|nr:hypothetical protein [Pseudoxanthomonas mexicana]UOV03499.1 hypothetical protein MUU75_09755 [Pseudoxanthomonas mexicana]
MTPLEGRRRRVQQQVAAAEGAPRVRHGNGFALHEAQTVADRDDDPGQFKACAVVYVLRGGIARPRGLGDDA